MMYQSINKKYFQWLYNHLGTYKKTILIILVLNILAVTFSLLFVEVTKIFMEGVEKGENFSFLMLAVSLATIKIFGIICAGLKTYVR